MKTTLRLTIAALVLATFNILAQTPAGLAIQTYAGLSITGAVGTVYSIDYVPDLSQTNTPGAWRCLELLQLPASPHLWVDKFAPATGKRFYRAVAMGAPTNMVFVPPGTFRMGSATNELDRRPNEGPQTAVIISRGFWMGKYEVTQGEYLAVMGNNPSLHTGDSHFPVEYVSWFDATNYCATLTQRERTAGRIGADTGYRLPTEAEWEYACRAGTSDRRFSYGDDPGYMSVSNQSIVVVGYTNLANYAWYGANSSGQTHPVGQRLPNPWGLCDMHGNVWEWCQDWLDGSAEYPGGVVIDPQGPATGSMRVMRGGSYDDYPWNCRSALRNNYFPNNPQRQIGFRIVLASGQP